jgi:hypothetical protein
VAYAVTGGENDLLDICPTGYSAVNAARPIGKRDRGVSLIFRESYRFTVTSVDFVGASFEHMVLLLQCNSVSIRLAVIYLPPSPRSAVTASFCHSSLIFYNCWWWHYKKKGIASQFQSTLKHVTSTSKVNS